MKKIRINELARELEVKAHEILDRLPELGVTEKKTHSSSIDEDVALKLRRLYGFDAPDLEPEESGAAEPEVEEPSAPEVVHEAAPVVKPTAEAPAAPVVHETAPVAAPPVEAPERPAAPAAPGTPAPAVLRPPLAGGGGRPIHPPVGPQTHRPEPPRVPAAPAAPQSAAPSRPAVPQARPIPSAFTDLRRSVSVAAITLQARSVL